MSSNKSMAIYTGVALLLLVVLMVALYGRFLAAPDKGSEPNLPASTSLQTQGQPVAEATSMAVTAPSEVAQTPLKALTILSPEQAQVAGLDLTKDTETDELLREIEAMNQDIQQLLSEPSIEERQQVDVAVTAQAEAFALIRQVDAQHGLNSLAQVDQQFEQTSIDDPQLQQIIAEGQQLEDEIATIAQALQ